jgi:hypothetical protein
MNLAQQLHQALGIAQGDSAPKTAHGNKNASATKRGPGRHHAAGHQKNSAPMGRGRVSTHQGRQRTYATLMAHFASQRVSRPGNRTGDGTNKRGDGLH